MCSMKGKSLKREEEDSSDPLLCLHLNSSSGSRLQTMGNQGSSTASEAVRQTPSQTETPRSWSVKRKRVDQDNREISFVWLKYAAENTFILKQFILYVGIFTDGNDSVTLATKHNKCGCGSFCAALNLQIQCLSETPLSCFVCQNPCTPFVSTTSYSLHICANLKMKCEEFSWWRRTPEVTLLI